MLQQLGTEAEILVVLVMCFHPLHHLYRSQQVIVLCFVMFSQLDPLPLESLLYLPLSTDVIVEFNNLSSIIIYDILALFLSCFMLLMQQMITMFMQLQAFTLHFPIRSCCDCTIRSCCTCNQWAMKEKTSFSLSTTCILNVFSQHPIASIKKLYFTQLLSASSLLS